MNIDPTKTHEALQYKHKRPLIACRFDPSAKYVFFGAEDNLVHRFDLKSKADTPLTAHDSWVRAIGFSPEGKLLYTGGYDGRLIFWPAADEKPQPKHVIEGHHGWVRALAVSPDGTRIATCGNDKLVKLWNAASGDLVAELNGHASHVYNVAFHPSGETLISCDLKGILKEWNVSTGMLKRDLSAADKLHKYDPSFRADIGGARSVAFSTDGKRLAVGGITNVTNAFAGIGNVIVVLIDMDSGKFALQLEAKDKINGTAWGAAHHPAGFWIGLAGGGGGGWLYFWKDDVKDNPAHEFFKLKLPTDGRDLALAPDKTQVAVAHSDGTLRLYALHDK